MRYVAVGMFWKPGIELTDAAPLGILITGFTGQQGAPITAQVSYRDMLHPAWKQGKKGWQVLLRDHS